MKIFHIEEEILCFEARQKKYRILECGKECVLAVGSYEFLRLFSKPRIRKCFPKFYLKPPDKFSIYVPNHRASNIT